MGGGWLPGSEPGPRVIVHISSRRLHSDTRGHIFNRVLSLEPGQCVKGVFRNRIRSCNLFSYFLKSKTSNENLLFSPARMERASPYK